MSRCLYIGVSKNRGTPKWMVKIMENPIKMDDLGKPTIFGNIHSDPAFTYHLWLCLRFGAMFLGDKSTTLKIAPKHAWKGASRLVFPSCPEISKQ